jgi:hypothetical protein
MQSIPVAAPSWWRSFFGAAEPGRKNGKRGKRVERRGGYRQSEDLRRRKAHERRQHETRLAGKRVE